MSKSHDLSNFNWNTADLLPDPYEVNFNLHFCRFTVPRPLAEIDADLKRAEDEFVRLLREVTAETRA